MSQKDFVYAWLLACRANPNVVWTQESMLSHIAKAQELYWMIEREV